LRTALKRPDHGKPIPSFFMKLLMPTLIALNVPKFLARLAFANTISTGVRFMNA
jgi:hypothetical protein